MSKLGGGKQHMPFMLSPKQALYYRDSNYKINISHGAVRSGKTFSTNLRWLKYIKEGPPGRLLMSGVTKETLKENVLNDLFALVGEANYTYNQTSGILVMFGRTIRCVGADSVRAESKIRGQTYAGWYGDEITLQHKTFVKQAVVRCSVEHSKIFWTTNPDHPKHYIKTDFIDNKQMKRDGLVGLWHFKLKDNHTLTSDYIEIVKASFSGVFYKRNIDGLWVIADGVVYGNDYVPKVHKVPSDVIMSMIEKKAFRYYIGGTDWGYTHPMVGLVYGVTHEGNYYLIDEFYKSKQKTEAVAKWFKDWEEKLDRQLDVIYCDSAEPDRIVTLQVEGLRAKASDKNIKEGINTVMTLFKRNKVYISEACENTDHELQVYRYPEEDDPKAKLDLPLDEDNHAMDAKRYVLHNFEKYLIKQQRKGDRKAKTNAKRRRLY